MKCETCGQVFGGVTAFDMHRVGQFEKGHMAGKRVRGRTRTVFVVDSPNTRRCLTAAEMEAKGLVYTSGKWCQRYGTKAA